MKKRLLILGGTAISSEIVEQAHKMGIDVYVTDYYPDSPAKRIADKSFLVSATDVDAVVALIKDEQIDGVITGYADILLPHYVEICKRAKLPCYASAEAIAITTNKDYFKKVCIKHHVPVVPEYTRDDVNCGKVNYPILVKPVDNSGARGIYICDNYDEFIVNYAKALEASPSKHVLIERYMTGKEATIFYFFHEGRAYLMGMGDRLMKKFDPKYIPLPIGYLFPSKAVPRFLKEENGNICELFRSLGIQEGMIFMQTFVTDEACVVYEMGYRLTGSLEHHLFEYAYGFNTMAAMIDIAVGNTLKTEALERIDVTKGCMANLTLLLRSGHLKNYEGLEEVRQMDGVLHVYHSYAPDTKIADKIMGTLAQVAVRVLLYAADKQTLILKMDTIKSTIKVLDDQGQNMLINGYTYSEIL